MDEVRYPDSCCCGYSPCCSCTLTDLGLGSAFCCTDKGVVKSTLTLTITTVYGVFSGTLTWSPTGCMTIVTGCWSGTINLTCLMWNLIDPMHPVLEGVNVNVNFQLWCGDCRDVNWHLAYVCPDTGQLIQCIQTGGVSCSPFLINFLAPNLTATFCTTCQQDFDGTRPVVVTE